MPTARPPLRAEIAPNVDLSLGVEIDALNEWAMSGP
jgi:hypothetical protein